MLPDRSFLFLHELGRVRAVLSIPNGIIQVSRLFFTVTLRHAAIQIKRDMQTLMIFVRVWARDY